MIKINNNGLNCSYHLNRQANAKCEKCGKLICLECKMIFHQSHTSGYGEDSYTYSTRHEFCTPCYYDMRMKADKMMVKVFIPFSFMVILMTIISGVFLEFLLIGIIGLLVGLILLIVVILYRLIIIPKKMARWEKKKQEFIDSLSSSKTSQASPIKKFCTLCGKEIQEDEEICENCGTKIESK